MSDDKDKVLAATVSDQGRQTSGDHPSSSEAEDDPDYTSSSGSSSEDEEYEGDVTSHQDRTRHSVQETVPHFRANENLKSRLAAFLPRIEQSNRELNADDSLESKRIDDVDEQDGQYIEMNLGLGVLSERSEAQNDIELHNGNNESDSEHDPDEEAEPRLVMPERSKLLRTTGSKKKIEEIDSS